MTTKATNIKINVDVNKAAIKARSLAKDFSAIGTTAQRTGAQVQQGMNQARTGIQQTGQAATTAAVNFQTMTQGMLNLSTAGVQTYTSISNLARAENRAKAAAVSLERATDLVNRKQLKLNELVAAGNGNTAKATLLRNELATATQDLTVKEEKLKIEQEAVLDVQLLFAANLVNVGVSSVQIYKTMTEGLTKAIVLQKLATIKSTFFTKLHTLANWNASHSLIGYQVQSKAATGTLYAQTAATRVATSATRIFQAALGPVGWLLIGIGAAYAAYETNLFGLKDSLHSLLGIQSEENDMVKDTTTSMEEHVEIMKEMNKGLTDLPSSYDAAKIALANYRQELKGMAADQINYITLNDAIAQGNKDLKESGFSKPTSAKRGQTGNLFEDLAAMLSPQMVYADDGTPTFVPVGLTPEAQKQAKQFGIIVEKLDEETLNQLVDISDKIDFYEAYVQDSVARARMFKAAQQQKAITSLATFKEYLLPNDPVFSTKFDPSIGGSFLLDQEEYDLDLWYRRIKSGKITSLTRQERDLYMEMDFARGRGGKNYRRIALQEDKRLKDLTNTEYVKELYGIDLGTMGNNITRSDAVRLGAMQKELRGFNAFGKVEGMTTLKGIHGLGVNAATSSIAQKYGLWSAPAQFYKDEYERRREKFRQESMGGRIDEVMQIIHSNTDQWTQMVYANNVSSYADRQIRANGYGGGRIGTNFFGTGFYKSAGATAAYQVERGSIKVPAWVKAQRERRDAFANSRSMGYLLGLQGILGRSGGGLGRRAADALRKNPIGSIGLGGFGISQFFGTEEEIIERLRERMRDFDMSDIDAPSKIQQIYNETVEDARKTAERIPSIPAQIGIDFAIGEYERGIIGSRTGTTVRGTSRYNRTVRIYGNVLKRFFSIEEIQQKIREDIQASSNIAIPTGRKLLEVTEAFNANGRFSNFNNVGITQDAMTGLNLTEQNVFNIRFNSTRGDRELLNRLRFQEMLQSMSSGTSSL